MAVDYDTLNTWMTPDLMFRDSMLMGRTRVMGMSKTAAIIHVVAIVCTSGTSLPINLAIGIWHHYRYRRVKVERKWIRQILSTRNMTYQGRGQWANVNPNANAAYHWNATPIGAHYTYNPAPGAQWMFNNPRASHLVQGTPGVGHWVHATPSGGHWVQPTPGIGQTVHVIPGGGHWVQPTPSIGQTVHMTPTPHADNDLQIPMQLAQDAFIISQQDFGNIDDFTQAVVGYDQS